jgi:hypothetical protein
VTVFQIILIILPTPSDRLAERGEWDPVERTYKVVDRNGVLQVSSYQSIPETFYWAVVTLSTVGYVCCEGGLRTGLCYT